MPYIRQRERGVYEHVLQMMDKCAVSADGGLNYILFAHCKRHVPNSYKEIRNYCAELRACATEIERRILAPYEDEQMKKNGDIYNETIH